MHTQSLGMDRNNTFLLLQLLLPLRYITRTKWLLTLGNFNQSPKYTHMHPFRSVLKDKMGPVKADKSPRLSVGPGRAIICVNPLQHLSDQECLSWAKERGEGQTVFH